MNLMIMSSLLVLGGMSTACAQAPFGDPPQEEDRRERIERLEVEIRDLETAMKDAPPERKDELKKRIHEKLAALKELKGGRPPQDGRHEKARRLQDHMREIEKQLERKDLPPEKREMLMKDLAESRARMKDLHDQAQGFGEERFSSGTVTAVSNDLDLVVVSFGRDAGVQEGDEVLLHRDKAFVGKIVIDRVDRAWSSGRMVLKGKEPPRIGDQAAMTAVRRQAHEALARGQQPPMDPELHKLHLQSMELERESVKLAEKLRRLPKDEPERSDLTAKLKEVVTRLFDLREQARVREVDMIRKRLEELTQLLEKRKANRDAIIEKRIKQLSGEADELDW